MFQQHCSTWEFVGNIGWICRHPPHREPPDSQKAKFVKSCQQSAVKPYIFNAEHHSMSVDNPKKLCDKIPNN